MLFTRNKIKLQKKRDVEYEIKYWSEIIQENGNQVINIIQKESDILIVYRLLYDLPEPDEYSLQLRMRIITSSGVLIPQPKLEAFINNSNSVSLADIVTPTELENKGYASVLLKQLIDMATKKKLNCITGFIAATDFDHIDKLYHFYQKHGFEINPENHTLLLKL